MDYFITIETVAIDFDPVADFTLGGVESITPSVAWVATTGNATSSKARIMPNARVWKILLHFILLLPLIPAHPIIKSI